MVLHLSECSMDEMLSIQAACERNGDLFIPTSREGYLRTFQYMNFCLGYKSALGEPLLAFLNCSIPTEKARNNLGRTHLADELISQVGHMNTLLVQPFVRKHGLGQILVAAALEEFMKRGIFHIFTTASRDNHASIHLLESMCFYSLGAIQLKGQSRNLYYRNLQNPPLSPECDSIFK